MHRTLMLVLLLMAVMVVAAQAQTEQLQITTYYPSPYGVYNEVRFYPHTLGGCSDATRGTVAYSTSAPYVNMLVVCDGTTAGWRPISGWWNIDASNIIYNINTATNDVRIADALSVTGALTVGGTSTLGSTTWVNGQLIVANGGAAYDITTQGKIYAAGGDLSEGFMAAADVGPGDVVAFDSQQLKTVKKATRAYDIDAIGVIATDSGMVLGNIEEGSMPLALTGQVPCKVTAENGKINPGDLLVSSSKPGYAMKAVFLDYSNAKDLNALKSMMNENEKRRASVIGKAITGSADKEGTVVAFITR